MSTKIIGDEINKIKSNITVKENRYPIKLNSFGVSKLFLKNGCKLFRLFNFLHNKYVILLIKVERCHIELELLLILDYPT
jgi:hypothetical protein